MQNSTFVLPVAEAADQAFGSDPPTGCHRNRQNTGIKRRLERSKAQDASSRAFCMLGSNNPKPVAHRLLYAIDLFGWNGAPMADGVTEVPKQSRFLDKTLVSNQVVEAVLPVFFNDLQ